MGLDEGRSAAIVGRLWRELTDRFDWTPPRLGDLPEPVSASHELRYVNVHWHDRTMPQRPAPPVGGLRGARGRAAMKAAAAHRLARFVESVMAPYFEEEAQYRAHTVRVLNSIAQSHDALIGAVAELRANLELQGTTLAERDALLLERIGELLQEASAAAPGAAAPGAAAPGAAGR